MLILAVAAILFIAGIALLAWEATPNRRARRVALAVFKDTGNALLATDYARVIELGTPALPLFEAESEPEYRLHWMIGTAALMVGAMLDAAHHLGLAAAGAERAPFVFEDFEKAHMHQFLGIAMLQLNRSDESRVHLDKSLQLAAEPDEKGFLLRLIASLEIGRDRFSAAKEMLDQAEPLSQQGRHLPGYQRILGYWHFSQDELDEADALFAAAERRYVELGEVVDAGYAATHRAEILSRRGREQEAVAAYRAALSQVTSRADNATGELYVLERLALSNARSGHLEDAATHIVRAEHLAAGFRSPESEARLSWAKAAAAAADRNIEEARDLLTSAAETFDTIGKQTTAARIRAEIAAL